jgi:hypothetical protein
MTMRQHNDPQPHPLMQELVHYVEWAHIFGAGIVCVSALIILVAELAGVMQ